MEHCNDNHYNFIQQSRNIGSMQITILLVDHQMLPKVRISSSNCNYFIPLNLSNSGIGEDQKENVLLGVINLPIPPTLENVVFLLETNNRYCQDQAFIYEKHRCVITHLPNSMILHTPKSL